MIVTKEILNGQDMTVVYYGDKVNHLGYLLMPIGNGCIAIVDTRLGQKCVALAIPPFPRVPKPKHVELFHGYLSLGIYPTGSEVNYEGLLESPLAKTYALMNIISNGGTWYGDILATDKIGNELNIAIKEN